jgi:IS5 family transposase
MFYLVRESEMTTLRHRQRCLFEPFFPEDLPALYEPWMRHTDRLLEDDELLAIVWEALGCRHPKSRQHGRPATPAEVVLRLLILKHVRNWSFAVLEREVRANALYRHFTRIGWEAVPDAKTLARIACALGPEVIARLHERLIAMARRERVVVGRKLRIDTTVVETNVHYPTDSSLLADGLRVLTRTMSRIEEAAGGAGEKLRDRMRSVGRLVMRIGRSVRSEQGAEQRRKLYGELLEIGGRVVAQARRFQQSIQPLGNVRLEGLRQQLEEMVERVEQVRRQTKQRVFGGDTHAPDKLLSVFEATTEVIRKGKAGKPNEFGKLLKVQEAENQIVTAYEVYEKRPDDRELLIAAVQEHERRLGRTPRLVAADAGFSSAANERALEQMGVSRVSIPNYATRDPARRGRQKQRWFKRGQKWRTGVEGRISVLKRRHGLDRSRYPGLDGMRRWVGLGVIADNLINIGVCLEARATS